MVHDLLYLLDSFCRTDPELALWALEALSLDVLDLDDGEVSLLPPLKLLIEKIEHSEVQTPQIVAPGEVDVIVGVQAGE